MLSLRPLKRAQRWLFGKPRSATAHSNRDCYALWLEERIRTRSSKQPRVQIPGLFSILTCIYHGSPAAYFREAAESVLGQSYPDFQWVVLAQGELGPELDQLLTWVKTDPRVTLLRIPENLGIFRGLRECLLAATGRYALPLDGDDLLTIDALEIMARAISEQDEPAFLYSDEDMYVEGQPRSPFLRVDWDPVLNLGCSYIWHLCAFDAALARELGVYTDLKSEWCQDWHSVFRFVDAGHRPVHVPEVLYHWRAHASSSTNQSGPHNGSLESQRHLLRSQIARENDPELFSIEPFPIFRGAHEWWLRRKPIRPQPMALVYYVEETASVSDAVRNLLEIVREGQFPYATVNFVTSHSGDAQQRLDLASRLQSLSREIGLPGDSLQIRTFQASGASIFAEISEPLVVVCEDGLRPDGGQWPWEAQALFELHPDLAMVAGRMINPDGIVCGGGEIFGFAGTSGCPEYGRLPHDPGSFGMLTKQRSVDAVNSAFFVARTEFLRQTKEVASLASTHRSLGIWWGAAAARQGSRIAATPLIAARVKSGLDVRSVLTESESQQIRRHFGEVLKTSRYYPAHASRNIGEGYAFIHPQ